MKIHELKDKEGRVFAFEVPNTLLTRRGLCKLVRSIPGARLLSGRKELRDEELHIRFLTGRFGASAVQQYLLEVTGLGEVEPSKRQTARYEE
jgi:hypothetical protein